MSTDKAIRQVNKYIRQGTLGNLPGSDILRFDMFYPSKEEQNEITKRIYSIDIKLYAEETLLQKYQSIKKGLMGDLLGGKKELK
jgi:type I restriction enzyme, S subunit